MVFSDRTGAFTRSRVRAESDRAARQVRDAPFGGLGWPKTRRSGSGDRRRPGRTTAHVPRPHRMSGIAASAKRRGPGLTCEGLQEDINFGAARDARIGVGSTGPIGLDGDFRLPHGSLGRRDRLRIPATGGVRRRPELSSGAGRLPRSVNGICYRRTSPADRRGATPYGGGAWTSQARRWRTAGRRSAAVE